MWYVNWQRVSPHDGIVCYAESGDGVTWAKPALRVHDFAGSNDNNICLRWPHNIDGVSVVEDPSDRAYPWKMIFYSQRTVDPGRNEAGLFAARSPDGLKWDVLPEGPHRTGFGDRMTAAPSRVNGKVVAFSRSEEMFRKYGMRTVTRSESEDLIHWTPPELVLKPDLEDSPNMEFYGMAVFPYAGLFLGALERMYRVPDVIDTELAVSRDTRKWTRTRARSCFLPRGSKGCWDSDWVNPAHSAPIRVGEVLYIFYSGRSAAHQVPYPLTQGAIGLGVLRLDGFAALEADFQEGWALTPPLRWPGGMLAINADTQRSLDGHPGLHHGEMRVECTDAEGAPLPGYGRAACDPMTGQFYAAQDDARSGVVRWGQRDTADLAGKTIRLKFHLLNARLYSFRSAS
jgi:hypothetical protein